MKHFFSENQTLHKLFALTAAAVLSLAAVGVKPGLDVYADDKKGEGTQTTATQSVEDENRQRQVAVDLKDERFYRWQRVTDQNITSLLDDGKEHRVLIISYNGTQFMNGTAPDCFRFGHEAPCKATFSETQRIVNEETGERLVGDEYGNSDDNEEGYFLFSQLSVSQTDINISSNVFFTQTDYNCPWIKLSGVDTKNWHEGSGTQCRTYNIRIPANEANSSHSYYLYNINDDGYMSVSVDKAEGNWTIQSRMGVDEKYKVLKDNNLISTAGQYAIHYGAGPLLEQYVLGQISFTSDKFELFTERGGGDSDECLFYKEKSRAFFSVNGDHSGDTFRLYVGEEYHFRKIPIDTDILDKTIYSVTSGDYVAAGNTKDHAEGTIIPTGITLKVKKGAILSVEGNLMVNGTIENEGLILVKKGGCIEPFLPSGTPSKDGCGAIRMLGGDLIIQEGGAVYGGIGTGKCCQFTDFKLSEGSTIINQGLLVYGGLELGENCRLELYPNSKTYGGVSLFPYEFSNTALTNPTLYSKFKNGSEIDAFMKKSYPSDGSGGGFYVPRTDAHTSSNWMTYGYHFVSWGNSAWVFTTQDFLHREVQYWMGGKDSKPDIVNGIVQVDFGQTTLFPMTRNVESDAVWNGPEICKMPFGLYLTPGISDANLPVIKQAPSAGFTDYFIDRRPWMRSAELSI